MTRRKGGKLTARADKPVPPSVSPYTVFMAKTAEAVYVEMYKQCKQAEERGDFTNYHCTAFHMVQDAIKNLIPRSPLDKRHALTGDLSNVFRIQKGRMRICWIASSQSRRVCILFISETLRKSGDANDPYAVFAGMVMSGRYDELFDILGVKSPSKSVPSARPLRIQ